MSIQRNVVPFLALVLAVTGSTAYGQATQQTATPSGVNVALLDVAYIFKNHVGFKQSMDGLRAQKKTIEDQILADRNRLMEKRKKGSETYKVGTPGYKQFEQELANEAADAQVKMELQKKELMEQEAQVYLATYNQVVQSVQAIAKQYQISLVLRYDSQPIDPNNPNDILKGINRAVIHQQNLDITKTVLEMVNRNVPRRPTAGAGNTLTTPATQQRPAANAARPNTFRNQ